MYVDKILMIIVRSNHPLSFFRENTKKPFEQAGWFISNARHGTAV